MKKDKNISGFKTPKDYFENFEEQLFSKISEESFPKSAGHIVPDGYFENLEEQILKKLTTSEKHTKVIQLFPKKYFGYAATIAASLIIGFTIFNNKTTPANLDTLQFAAIETYIEEGNLNLDLYELTSYLDDEDFSNLNFEDYQLSETTLKNYILENVDEETLINEQ